MPGGRVGRLYGEGMRTALDGNALGCGVDGGDRARNAALLPIFLNLLMDGSDVGLGHHQSSAGIPCITSGRWPDDDGAITSGHAGKWYFRTLLGIGFAGGDPEDHCTVGSR